MRGTLALAVLLIALTIPGGARAHPLGFGVVSIRQTAPGEADVVVRISGTESEPGRIALAWPDACAETVVSDAMGDEVRERRSHVRCEGAIAGTTMHVDGPARGLEVLVETELEGTSARQTVRTLPADVPLGAATDAAPLALAQARLGAAHFALGIDHVLFVVGAFFLARRRGGRAVAIAVTAFTIGHAITLALATVGAATIPTRPVEACIALSLVHVARELRVEASTITRHAPAVACGLFGLVHGAGLASALSGAGLRGLDLGLAVASFNVGLELAELALVLVLFALVRGPFAERAERASAMAIGGVGVWLLLDRLF